MKTMKTLSIDIETFSDVDLTKSGVYPYAESSNFKILLFGYSVDGQPPQVIDLINGEQIPEEILHALTDPDVIKTAYNAMFERIYYMKELLPSVRRMVKKRKPGIFRNTFIIHRKKAYGYAENGAAYLLNAADVRRCARYRWTIRNGYVVSFDIIPGSCVRLDSFLTEVHSP